MRRSQLWFLLALALTAGAAQAKVYKWVDDQGQVHYGARPPARQQAQEMKVRPAPPSAQQASERAAEPAEPGQDQQEAEPDKPPRAEKRDAALKKNCEMARNNLKVLQDPSNRRFRTEDGEVTYFSDEQRQKRIDEAQQYVDEFCK